MMAARSAGKSAAGSATAALNNAQCPHTMLSGPLGPHPRVSVSLEGINGVGKTYLGALATRRLGDESLPLAELPDSGPSTLPGQIISTLRAGGDLFLRTGYPRTETLLLIALHVHRHEATPVGRGQVILEDRGPHSVAVYQAAILAEADHMSDADALKVSQLILGTIAQWRPLPQITLLLRDESARCRSRFEERLGRPTTPDERALMARVDQLYGLMADTLPHEFRIIDRRHDDEDAAVAAVVDACRHVAATVATTGEEAPSCPS